MKTLNKKILTACLALMMAVAMAIPTFAAENSARSVAGDSFSSYGNTYYQLNAATDGTPGNGTLVTMWHNTGSPTQRWSVIPMPGSQYFWFQNAACPDVVLSYNGQPQARLSFKNTSQYGIATQAIKMIDEGTDNAGLVRYGLALPSYLLGATATGYSDGRPVQWLGSNGQNNQLWVIQLYN